MAIEEYFAEPFLRDIPTHDDNNQDVLNSLKLLAQQIYKKRVLLQQEYGVVLDAQMTLVARLTFITERIFGITTLERLSLEIDWLEKHILGSLEQAHSQALADRRGLNLHLPQGKVKIVKPLENGKDNDR